MDSPYTVVIKPIGPQCNLRCEYCFYSKKTELYPDTTNFKMPDNVLEIFIRDYLKQDASKITFNWQGGEPTLLGVDFFKKAVLLQNKYKKDKKIYNSIQTNGTLIDDEWCIFLKKNNFLVGLSLDGPDYLHNIYRKNAKGEGSFKDVLRGLKKLSEHNVEYNILCSVNNKNVRYPKDVYEFFREESKTNYWQFIPIVERDLNGKMGNFSVDSDDFGKFLIYIFDRWIKKDIGRISIQLFDCVFNICMGLGASLCAFEPVCGCAPALEHNGDLYACDHFVDRDYFLGNILDTNINILANSKKQIEFGNSKLNLPTICSSCDVRIFCNGECIKNRFIEIEKERYKLNYLCKAYKDFFQHVKPYMNKIRRDLKKGLDLRDIVKSFK